MINGRIISTMLGTEDHSIPTAFVEIGFENGSVQGFGGYDLREKNSMLNFVIGVQDAVGASDWSQLKNMYVRTICPIAQYSSANAPSRMSTSSWFAAT